MKFIFVLFLVTSFHGTACKDRVPTSKVVPGLEGGYDSNNITWKYFTTNGYEPDKNWSKANPLPGQGHNSVQDWAWVTGGPLEGWNTDLHFDDSTWASGLAVYGHQYNSSSFYASDYVHTQWGGVSNSSTESIFMRRKVAVEGPIDVDTLFVVVTNDDSYEFYINGELVTENKNVQKVSVKNPIWRAAARAALKIGCGQMNLLAVRAFDGGDVGIIDVGLYSSDEDWPCGNSSEDCFQDAGGDPTKCVPAGSCTGLNYVADNTTGKCRGPSSATQGNGLPCPVPPSNKKSNKLLLLFILLPILLLLLLLAALITACLLYRRRKKKGKNAYVDINSDPNAYTPRAAVANPSQYQPSMPRIPVSGLNVRNNNRVGGY